MSKELIVRVAENSGRAAKVAIKRESQKIVAKQGAKIVARMATKTAAKTVARTAANPALLIADGVEIVAENLGASTRVCKVAGFGTSVAIGAGLGGPIGAAAGAGVWLVGEAIGALFD